MYRLFIADDEQIIRKGLMKIVDWATLGFEIAGEAANGRDALNFILENKPDVVMLDIKMPLMHGLDVIKEARAKGYDGVAIILSGFSEFSYAQQAISQNVRSYITKPFEKDTLLELFNSIKAELDSTKNKLDRESLYENHGKEGLFRQFLIGNIPSSEILYDELGLGNGIKHQLVIYEKFSYDRNDSSYNFSELLNTTNGMDSYIFVSLYEYKVLLLVGVGIINRFQKILDKYKADIPPEKNSPLDTLFFSCGDVSTEPSILPETYAKLKELLGRRFFLDKNDHFINFDYFEKISSSNDNDFTDTADGITDSASNPSLFMKQKTDECGRNLINAIQAFNRTSIDETLEDLSVFYAKSPVTIDEQKQHLVDLYLQVKEQIKIIYRTTEIPFINNQKAFSSILNSYYLCEITDFLSDQFEMIMSSIGFSSRDNIIDNIVHYINYNYAENISLESIAPLFGYNSSYLGKIFSKKMGINFNAYLDSVRIQHSKELLLTDKLQVYKIAELVGYRNVDYFHIKFKKNTGMSPAEYRKQNS